MKTESTFKMTLHAEDIQMENTAELIAELASRVELLEDRVRELEYNIMDLTAERD
jgi:hypothetical protein